MSDEDLTPQLPPHRREENVRRRPPEREMRGPRLSAEAEAYLDGVLARLEAERYEIAWDERGFDCIATLSRFEITKFGFVDYTIVFVEFNRLDSRSLWDFSRAAFDYAVARGGMSMPGLQGLKICLPVAMIGADAGAVAAVRDVAAPKHFAKLEFPCLFDLRTGELHYFQGTPIWGAFYYAGLRELAVRLFQP